jgi:hypothetical protein
MKNPNPEAGTDISLREQVPTRPGPLAELMRLPREGRAPRTVEHALPAGRRVEVALDAETVRIVGAEGRVELTVKCTDAGCVLQFETANLSLQNQGKIHLQCEELNVETSKQLSLHSQGHISTKAEGGCSTEAAGTIETRASEIHMQATVGDAVVKANDFVRLKGEQILLNSDDDPRGREQQLHDLWSKLTGDPEDDSE